MKLKVIGGYHDGRRVYVRDEINVGEVWNIREDIKPHTRLGAKLVNNHTDKIHSYVVVRRARVEPSGYKREWKVLEALKCET